MMYKLIYRTKFDASHFLNLPYESKCQNLHGHTWLVEIEIKVNKLNENGMVVDFSKLKKIVEELDHSNLNDIFDFNPTCENIAEYIYQKIQEEVEGIIKVKICETEGHCIEYTLY